MAATKGSANIRRRKFGKVTAVLSLHTGIVTWIPKGGSIHLTKEQRQEACQWLLPEANAWDLLPKDPKPDGTHPEENIMAAWKKLGLTPEVVK